MGAEPRGNFTNSYFVCRSGWLLGSSRKYRSMRTMVPISRVPSTNRAHTIPRSRTARSRSRPALKREFSCVISSLANSPHRKSSTHSATRPRSRSRAEGRWRCRERAPPFRETDQEPGEGVGCGNREREHQPLSVLPPTQPGKCQARGRGANEGRLEVLGAPPRSSARGPSSAAAPSQIADRRLATSPTMKCIPPSAATNSSIAAGSTAKEKVAFSASPAALGESVRKTTFSTGCPARSTQRRRAWRRPCAPGVSDPIAISRRVMLHVPPFALTALAVAGPNVRVVGSQRVR